MRDVCRSVGRSVVRSFVRSFAGHVPRVLGEGVVPAAHPDLAPGHGVRLGEQQAGRQQEQPEHGVARRVQGDAQGQVPRRRPFEEAAGEEVHVAESEPQEEHGDVPRLEPVSPERDERSLWQKRRRRGTNDRCWHCTAVVCCDVMCVWICFHRPRCLKSGVLLAACVAVQLLLCVICCGRQ